MCDGFGFWSCCVTPSGLITWRRYGTASPPDFEQLCDTGAACTPFAVDVAKAVYLAGQKWSAAGVLLWTAPFVGASNGVAVSPDGTKVLFVGNLTLPNQQQTLTASAFAIETGGAVALDVSGDTLALATDYAAMQFSCPVPQYWSGYGTLTLSCSNRDALTANVTVGTENNQNPQPLAAEPDNISTRAQMNAAAWDATASLGWNTPGVGATIPASLTSQAGYAAGNLMTVIVQGRPTEFQPCNLEIDLAANPPQLNFTIVPAPMCAVCCDAATGAILWSLPFAAVDAVGEIGAGTPGFVVAAPDSSAFFFTASNGDYVIGVSAASGSPLFATFLGNPHPTGGLAFGIDGQLYGCYAGALVQVNPASGIVENLWYAAVAYCGIYAGRNSLIAYSDGTFGGVNSSFARFEKSTESEGGGTIPTLATLWTVAPAFQAPDTVFGFVACAADAENNTYLVNGGQLWRVNGAGETVYAYPVPLVPPLEWTDLVAAQYLQLDSAGEPIIGGAQVQYQAPG
jgi:hypothetical protein